MQSHFLIINGMSGAGKTQVVRTLEDLNFFCIDNLPATLIPKFSELCRQTSEDEVALVVDIRGGQFFDKLLQVLDEMEASGQKYELLFLDASDESLVRRYKETRRRHPLGERNSLLKNITNERQMLDPLREEATYIIDTSDLTTAQLKAKVTELFGEGTSKDRMVLWCVPLASSMACPWTAIWCWMCASYPIPSMWRSCVARRAMTALWLILSAAIRKPFSI